jgi:multidrug efflux system outer membrane protein
MCRREQVICLVALIVLLSACAVGPDYHKPEIAGGNPAGFANTSQPGIAGGEIEVRFWETFDDAALNDLVKEALVNNLDERVAAANLRVARAAFRLSEFDLLPTVTANADHQRVLRSTNELPGFSDRARHTSNVDVGFDAFWELDFFGRVRREVERSHAQAQAIEATLHNVQVTLTAEVARDYFTLRGLQDQLAVAERNAHNQEQSLQLTQVRLEAGRGNELDTSRAEAQLRTTQAQIPPLEASIGNTIYALGVLVGRQPDSLTSALSQRQPLPALPTIINVGTPEALLRRRPDVQVAERNLAAATAGIGVAVGDLFPKITFVGSVGYNASSLGRVGDSGSQTYAYGPGISWAAFDLGRVRARIKEARANADAEMAAYEKAVLVALQETDGALISYSRSSARTRTLEQAALASDKAARLARQRYEAGLSDFLIALDAERDALNAETSLAQSRTETATDLVAVYKALGGAWQGFDRAPAAKAAAQTAPDLKVSTAMQDR